MSPLSDENSRSEDDVRASRDDTNATNASEDKARRAHRPGTEPFERWERDEMEKLLGQLCGHLGMHFFELEVPLLIVHTVLFPNRFLEGEDVANNFLFNADRYDLSILLAL